MAVLASGFGCTYSLVESADVEVSRVWAAFLVPKDEVAFAEPYPEVVDDDDSGVVVELFDADQEL